MRLLYKPIYLSVLLTLFLFITPQLLFSKNIYSSNKQGVFELKNWNPDTDGIIEIEGQVPYFWNQKITGSNDIGPVSGMVKIPGFWAIQQDTFLLKNSQGLLTYALKINLPDSVHQYTLKLKSVLSAYEIWANGVLLSKTGIAGFDQESTQPDFQPQLINLPKAKKVELFWVVSNFHHWKGGGHWEKILLGKEDQINKYWLNAYTQELIGVSIILIVSLYHFILFAFYPKEQSYLAFACYSFTSFVFLAIRGEMVIQLLFPSFPFELDQKIRYISYYINISSIPLYTILIFPKTSNKIAIGFLGFGVLLSIVTSIMPVLYGTYISPYFHGIGLIVGLYCMFQVFNHFNTHKIESLIFIGGGGVLMFTMVYSLLVTLYIIKGEYIHNIGHLVFILAQTILIAYKHRKLYVEKEFLKYNLAYKEKDLQTVLSANKVRFQVSEETKEKLESLYKMDEKDVKKELKSLLDNLKFQSITDQKINFTQENIENINTELHHKLKSIYPNLTKSELEICQLTLLKLSTKEIAHIRNTSEGAIKVARHRIKKKMNLEKSDDLHHTISHL